MKQKKKLKLEDTEPTNMKEIDELLNGFNLEDCSRDIGRVRSYLERLILIIERSRIRDYMMLTDSKRRLFAINFVAGLGKGFGQAIGFTVLAGIAFYILTTWIDFPIIGEYIAKLLDIIETYRRK